MMSKPKNTYKIGVTGSIACGKSLVRKILDNLDIPSIDADEIVHEILQKDRKIIEQIVTLFGPEILNNDGGINRKELAKIVFPDQQKLKQLESIIHPHTYNKIDYFINESNKDIVAVVIPLLFENNRQHMFDIVWLVTTEENQQIERLKLRDEVSDDEAKQRIAAQMPQNVKMAMADVIIDNSGSVEQTQKQVESLVSKIRENY